MSGRIVGHTEPDPIHECDPPSTVPMPAAYRQGTIWQCDCGRTFKATRVVFDLFGECMEIWWSSEGWSARRRRERAAARVAPPAVAEAGDGPPADFDG